MSFHTTAYIAYITSLKDLHTVRLFHLHNGTRQLNVVSRVAFDLHRGDSHVSTANVPAAVNE